MERNRYRTIAAALGALVIGVTGASTVSAAVDCPTFEAKRIAAFTKSVERAVARCLRRHPAAECVDAKASARLDVIRTRTAAKMEKRCPSGDAAERLADAQSDAYCRLLAQCPSPTAEPTPSGGAGSMTVRVTGGSAARGARSTGHSLSADMGWTGQVRNVQVFEGAAYTAQLSNCDGTTDTQCDFHAAVSGTRFGAPAQMAGGGVTMCLILDFLSDVDGTVDLTSGDLTQSMLVKTSVYVGIDVGHGCPACLTADGDPSLGEAGTCSGGPADGAPCTVDGLSDPMYLSTRGTSNDCQPNPAGLIGEEFNQITSTTGEVMLATTTDSPGCRAAGFRDVKCLCDTCNSAGTYGSGLGLGDVCASNADCPMSGGQPGICGGARCIDGTNGGMPCAVHSDCPGSHCYRPGAATAPNQCDDAVCTPDGDGGVCASGPFDARCTIEGFRNCAAASDCPAAGDSCETGSFRPCVPDPLVRNGVPDAPMDNVAHPTLIGAFCMGPTYSAATNLVTGLPGPVTYTWPTEVTFTN